MNLCVELGILTAPFETKYVGNVTWFNTNSDLLANQIGAYKIWVLWAQNLILKL